MFLKKVITIFKGILISESLVHPSILNNLRKLDVAVNDTVDTPEAPVWHLFKVEIADDQLGAVIKLTEDNFKYGWYAHYWNGTVVHVCFQGKTFTIPQEAHWSSPEFQIMKAYAVSHGVAEKYLDIDTRP